MDRNNITATTAWDQIPANRRHICADGTRMVLLNENGATVLAPHETGEHDASQLRADVAALGMRVAR